MSDDRPILVLGGTAEARSLAIELNALSVPFVSSLAGSVADPRLPVGQVRIGGFGGVGGLRDWVVDHGCRAVVDATHPFAQQISTNAATALATLDVPLVVLRRPEWVPGPHDRWIVVADIGSAAAALGTSGRRVLLTTGRQDVDAFAGNSVDQFVIRVVDPPTGALPPHHEIIRSRGPYDLHSERNLMRDRAIDVLVTKNSGGTHTYAKLIAARELGIEVVMVARPPAPSGVRLVDSVSGAITAILDRRSAAR